MAYRYVKSTDESIVKHADHIREEWAAHVCDISDAPEYVDGNSSGLCCHTCSTIVVEVTA